MVMRGNTGQVQRATTIQDRMEILAEVADAVRATAEEWLKTYATDADEGILHGAQMRYVWQTDGSVLIKLDDEVVMRAAVQITVEPVEVLDAAPPAEPEVNKPTGFVRKMTWATVPAGWFIKDPKGRRWEVLQTKWTPWGQCVAMQFEGQRGEWTRDPDGEVHAQRGTLAPKERDDAISALGEAFTVAVLKDGEGPMQS